MLQPACQRQSTACQQRSTSVCPRTRVGQRQCGGGSADVVAVGCKHRPLLLVVVGQRVEQAPERSVQAPGTVSRRVGGWNGWMAGEEPNRSCCPVIAQLLHSDHQQRCTNSPGAGELVGIQQRLRRVLPRRHPLVERHQLVCKHGGGGQPAFSGLAGQCCRRARWGAGNGQAARLGCARSTLALQLRSAPWPAAALQRTRRSGFRQLGRHLVPVRLVVVCSTPQQAQRAQPKRAPRWQRLQRAHTPPGGAKAEA